MYRPVLALALATALLQPGFGVGADPLEDNRALIREFVAISNAAQWDRLGEVMSDDFLRHSAATAGPPVESREAFIELQKRFLQSFPDQEVVVRQLITEGDRVALLADYRGTHLGPMGEFPPTDRRVDGPFIAIFRIDQGKIAELWVEWDNLALLNQLGLFPPPAPGQDP